MKGQRNFIVFALLLAALSGSHDAIYAQTPAFVEPIFDPAAGKTLYVLSARQTYSIWIAVDSECGWPNTLDVTPGKGQQVDRGRTWVQIASLSADTGMAGVTVQHPVSGQIVGADTYTCEPRRATYETP